MEVPAGESELVLELTGGSITGAFALYVAQGTSVGTSTSQYDCKDSVYPGRCVFENPASGTWSIMIATTSYYSGVRLSVTGTLATS